VAPRFHQFLKTLPDNKGLTAIELRQLLKIRFILIQSFWENIRILHLLEAKWGLL